MKKILFLFLVVCGLFFGCAGRMAHIRWAPNLDQGLAGAKDSNKLIVLNFYSPT